MTRLMTLTSGLFVASLAILPISAFAQPNAAVGKTEAKTVTHAATPADVKMHHAKHVSTQVGTAKTTAGTQASPTTQPKSVDQGKS